MEGAGNAQHSRGLRGGAHVQHLQAHQSCALCRVEGVPYTVRVHVGHAVGRDVEWRIWVGLWHDR